ncbi:hypothetical protein [Caulobacter sp. S45]|uniref:hypothetical protein n=1 Tax=Caulobacter sp. S45 TaxID=1641861 RepID=UPI00131DDA10|nr:hypothetical protein [Caulobacter sp. S45]
MKRLTTLAISTALTLGVAGLASAQDQAGPMADPHATQNPAIKSPKDMTQAPLAKGHNSFTKAQARGRIRKAGYANVTDLTLDADGLWQAHATRDGQTVNVALDYKGNVAAQ